MKIDEANTPYEAPLLPEDELDIPEFSLGASAGGRAAGEAAAVAAAPVANPVHAAGEWGSDDEAPAAEVTVQKKSFKELRNKHYNMKAASECRPTAALPPLGNPADY